MWRRWKEEDRKRGQKDRSDREKEGRERGRQRGGEGIECYMLSP
jgi:hypothetical protein